MKNGNIVKEIETRRARRAIDNRSIDTETIGRILTAATWAPSCANKQPWRLIVVDAEPALAKVRENLLPGNYWALKAPVYVLAVTNEELDCRLEDRRDYAFFDTGLAVMNLMLQATSEGLIAHPIAGYQPVQLKEAMGIPADHTLIAVVVLGYPGDESGLNEKHLASEHSERTRKDQGDVIFRNRWPVKD